MRKLSRGLKFSRVSIIFVLIFLFSAFYIFMINSNRGSSDFLAREGFLDLSYWDGQGLVKLDGQWELYPNQLLEPGDLSVTPSYAEVPGSLKGYVTNPREGGASYRLRLVLPEKGSYGISLRDLRQASRVFIDGQEMASFGQVSLDEENFRDGSGHRIVSIGNRDVELVIQLASFSYKKAGIFSSLELGSLDRLLEKSYRARALESLTIVISLFLGVYFVLSFFTQPSSTYMAYLGLAYLFMALYLSSLGEELLALFISYSHLTGLRIQLFSLLMSSFFLLLTTHEAFPKYSKIKYLKILLYLIILANLSLFISFESLPPLIEGAHRGLLFLVFTLSYFYIFYLIIGMIINKEKYYKYLFVLSLSALYYWLINVLELFMYFDTGYIKLVLMVFIFVNMALLLGHIQRLERVRLLSLTRKLQADEELKNFFLARLSRELKRPLAKIKKELNYLTEGRAGLLSSRQQMRVYYLNQELLRLTRISDELIEASHLEIVSNSPEPLDPAPIIEELIGELEPLLVEGVELIRELPDKLPWILSDRESFVQVLYKLFTNALENTQQGFISLAAKEQGGFLIFTIRDTGIGIPREDLEHIFELFYRIEGREFQGLGLGLSIVKFLVESQGGSIEATSSPEDGTCFSFRFPVFKGTHLGSETLPTGLELPDFSSRLVEKGRIYTILAYGLSQDCQETLKTLLRDGPFRLFISMEEDEALAFIEEKLVDFVLLDHSYHQLRKNRLLELIREKFSPVELPVLALISSGINVEFLEVLEGGANDYLRKPLNPREFIPRFQSLLMMKLSVEEEMEREFKYSYLEISPHFLYNTINTIIALSHEDGERTRRALKNLAIYFRGKLDSGEKVFISLKDELKLIYAYLEIEKMRFDDLELIFDIDETINSMIPPLTLQPLVENAMTHGLKPKRGKGWIRLKVAREGTTTLIVIEDSGLGMEEDKLRELLAGKAPGLGFSNVLAKLKMIRGASLKLISAPGEGTRVEIRLPRLEER